MACEDPNAPLFMACHLEGEGTVSEDRNKNQNNNNANSDSNQAPNKKPQNAADIINASANGLDSITGFLGSLMGKPSPSTPTYLPAPDPPPKPSPWLIGGVIGGVVLLIALLIFFKHGKSNE
ncbi:hypothetical protein [Aureispira sp. CCB-E]|uniref:hypothetical protein n=1 Tax=Aureispira sp. CCB-E TaxID=3051121 RepID=UPI0028695978|nr:hypothetical protein [Aureispira sp. CCB-E]WMX16323.1 hypothetical protein QP953_08090 [Aureispira sp. CCB-E]